MKIHALAVVPMMLHAVRPSRIADMPAVASPFWLGKGYEALTFFGTIITHSQQEARHVNARYDALKNHEMIHLRQAQAVGDSWWRFYWKYFVFWLRASRYCRRVKNAGYRLNPFEMEAYAHMHDLHYLDQCRSGANEWRRYAAMSLAERARLIGC